MALRRKVTAPAVKKAPLKSSPASVRGKLAGSTASKSSGVSKAAPIMHGRAGFEVGAQKQQRQQERYDKMRETPYRVGLKPGEEAEFVILDAEDLFFVTEHTIKVKGRWENVVCIADTGETCPACEDEGREGSFTLMLTVLDRRQYRKKNGDVVKVSKKLLPVKGRNMAKFKRAFDKYNSNFRGVVINCARSGDKEARIGEDITFDKRIPEAVLKKYGDNAKVAEYSKIFEVLSPEDMAKTYGLSYSGSGGGTTKAGAQDFGSDSNDGDLDSVGGW